jgi:hypothetical protein
MLSAVRSGSTRASGATPAIPSPLFVAAASTPATFVPCSLRVSEVGTGSCA